jgi:hypothetical protein
MPQYEIETFICKDRDPTDAEKAATRAPYENQCTDYLCVSDSVRTSPLNRRYYKHVFTCTETNLEHMVGE